MGSGIHVSAALQVFCDQNEANAIQQHRITVYPRMISAQAGKLFKARKLICKQVRSFGRGLIRFGLPHGWIYRGVTNIAYADAICVIYWIAVVGFVLPFSPRGSSLVFHNRLHSATMSSFSLLTVSAVVP